MKWIGIYHINFKCEPNNTNNYMKNIQQELVKINFGGDVKFEKETVDLKVNFKLYVKLICSDILKLDKTIIKFYVLMNHITEIINSVHNQNSVFDWSRYDDYNCEYENCEKLKMVYSENSLENTCGFPIMCTQSFCAECTTQNDTFETLENIFEKMCI